MLRRLFVAKIMTLPYTHKLPCKENVAEVAQQVTQLLLEKAPCNKYDARLSKLKVALI